MSADDTSDEDQLPFVVQQPIARNPQRKDRARCRVCAGGAIVCNQARLCLRLGDLHRLVPGHGLQWLPATPEIVAVFVADQADGGFNPSTIGRRVAATGHHHRASGHPAPTATPTAGRVAEVLAGIRAEKGVARRQKRPADASALRNTLAAIEGDGLRAIRDRAVLAIGMAAALRRSELVALEVDHVGIVPKKLEILIAKSKTDQQRMGVTIAIPEGSPIWPKALLLDWRAAAGHTGGPLFRRLIRLDALTEDAMPDRAVARLVQRYAGMAGSSPATRCGQAS